MFIIKCLNSPFLCVYYRYTDVSTLKKAAKAGSKASRSLLCLIAVLVEHTAPKFVFYSLCMWHDETKHDLWWRCATECKTAFHFCATVCRGPLSSVRCFYATTDNSKALNQLPFCPNANRKLENSK